MHIFRIIKSTFLLVLLLFVLHSCVLKDECIDPDDWGGVKQMTVSSYGSQILTLGAPYTQAIAWTPGPQLDGKRVMMVVKNSRPQDSRKNQCQGSDLFSGENSWLAIWGKYFQSPADYQNLKLCAFQDPSTAAPAFPWCPANSDMSRDNIPVINMPCKFYLGLGLYAMATDQVPPYLELAQPLFHLGDSAPELDQDGRSIGNTSIFFSQGCPTGGASFDPSGKCKDSTCSLYFKMMDRYYGSTTNPGDDNLGSYTVVFKQGVKNSSVRLISRFVGIVNAVLCSVSQSMYQNIVKNTDFLAYVRVLLILAIAFLGFSIVTGFSDLSYKKMLILVLKIGLVMQLCTTQTSWNFFNDRFFKLFKDGIGEVTGIIFGVGSADLAPVDVDLPDGILPTRDACSSQDPPSSCQCKAQSLAGFAYFDDVLSQLFSRETTLKILSLFTYKGAGFLYVPILYLCLTVVLFVLLKSLLIYLVSILVISIIIALAPLFIPFILFDKTKHIFDGWLKALISYFIQPIIIMTFAFFILQIFIAQLHNLVGYRVCWKEWWKLGDLFTLYAWQVDIAGIDQPSPDPIKACILTPTSILEYCNQSSSDSCDATKGNSTGSSQFSMVGSLNIANSPGPGPCSYYNPANIPSTSGGLCLPYVCAQDRYIDFPYLDPSFPPDQNRVNEIKSGTLISIPDIILLIMLIWFMYEFSKLVPNMAKQLATGSVFGGVNLGGVSAQMASGLWSAVKKSSSMTLSGLSAVTGRDISGTARALRFGVQGIPAVLYEKAAEKVSKKYDQISEKLSDRLAQAPAPVRKAIKVIGGVGKVGGFIGRAVFAPHKLIGDGLGLVGKNAIAPVTNKISQAKGLVESNIAKRITTPLDMAVDKALGIKHPEAVSEKSAELNQKANMASTSGDTVKAFDLYTQAAQQGHPKAMVNLANMYEKGLGGAQVNLMQAKKLYAQAAQAGDEFAKSNLSRISKEIEQRKQDYTNNMADLKTKLKAAGSNPPPELQAQAAALYKKGVQIEEPSALAGLAVCHADGTGGVEKDAFKAHELFQRARNAGADISGLQTKMDAVKGRMEEAETAFSAGQAKEVKTPQDALKDYEKAAKHGHTGAMVKMADIYLQSQKDADKEKAHTLLKKAADGGNRDAVRKLDSMQKRG